ncbi:MAG: DUF6158 family protein [Actinomycetes bacterium]
MSDGTTNAFEPVGYTGEPVVDLTAHAEAETGADTGAETDAEQLARHTDHGPAHGVDPQQLSDDDLRRELERVHDMRHTTFLHGTDDAWQALEQRTRALESEYLRRWPEREVDPDRTRAGARARAGQSQGV